MHTKTWMSIIHSKMLNVTVETEGLEGAMLLALTIEWAQNHALAGVA